MSEKAISTLGFQELLAASIVAFYVRDIESCLILLVTMLFFFLFSFG